MDQKPERDSPTRVGHRMWLLAWVLGVTLLTLFFSEREQQLLNPNANPESLVYDSGMREVILKRNRNGHYITSGTINQHPAEFLLDTGASDVVIPADLADLYGLQPGYPKLAMTANGPVKIYSTTLESLRIGTIVLHNVSASINPHMQESILLGMSALRQIDFIQKGDQLTLRQYPPR